MAHRTRGLWSLARGCRAGRVAWLLALSGCAHRADPGSQTPEFLIEKPALMIGSNPKPKYPAELLPTQDTGTVAIRVIVDASGSAQMRTVEVLSSPHPAFTRAVLEVLADYRFIPAEVGGGPPRDCRAVADGVEYCKPGRPGKKVSQPVDINFRFAPPPPDSAA